MTGATLCASLCPTDRVLLGQSHLLVGCRALVSFCSRSSVIVRSIPLSPFLPCVRPGSTHVCVRAMRTCRHLLAIHRFFASVTCCIRCLVFRDADRVAVVHLQPRLWDIVLPSVTKPWATRLLPLRGSVRRDGCAYLSKRCKCLRVVWDLVFLFLVAEFPCLVSLLDSLPSAGPWQAFLHVCSLSRYRGAVRSLSAVSSVCS